MNSNWVTTAFHYQHVLQEQGMVDIEFSYELNYIAKEMVEASVTRRYK